MRQLLHQMINIQEAELCVAGTSQCELSDHQFAIVNNLSLLIYVPEGEYVCVCFVMQNSIA